MLRRRTKTLIDAHDALVSKCQVTTQSQFVFTLTTTLGSCHVVNFQASLIGLNVLDSYLSGTYSPYSIMS